MKPFVLCGAGFCGIAVLIGHTLRLNRDRRQLIARHDFRVHMAGYHHQIIHRLQHIQIPRPPDSTADAPGVRQGGFFRVEMDSDGVEVGHAQHQAGLIVANSGRVGLRMVQPAGAVDHSVCGAPGQGMVYALTFLVSMGVAALCVLCMRRFQLNWMGSFIMSISLIVSMAASVFLERLLK